MNDDDREAIRDEKREELIGREEHPEDEEDRSESPDEPIRVESVEQFSQVTTEYGSTLVDFHADWCGPCNTLEPVVASVAANTDAAVAKVDVDEHQGLAAQYGVRSVPTLLLFAGGEQVEQLVGAQDEAALTRLVERYA